MAVLKQFWSVHLSHHVMWIRDLNFWQSLEMKLRRGERSVMGITIMCEKFCRRRRKHTRHNKHDHANIKVKKLWNGKDISVREKTVESVTDWEVVIENRKGRSPLTDEIINNREGNDRNWDRGAHIQQWNHTVPCRWQDHQLLRAYWSSLSLYKTVNL